ncbi:MAG: hypothetical protein PW788_14155 [Micavibrio sp.]|nr:hypothetical protein [Micavibrio sp.]
MTISSLNGSPWYSTSTAKTQNKQSLPGSTGSLINSLAGTGGDDAATTGISASKKTDSTASTKFLDYMKQTPAQRLQEAWLAQHNITQQQFDAMGADEKQKLIDQMKQEMQAKMQDRANSPDHKPVDILV